MAKNPEKEWSNEGPQTPKEQVANLEQKIKALKEQIKTSPKDSLDEQKRLQFELAEAQDALRVFKEQAAEGE